MGYSVDACTSCCVHRGVHTETMTCVCALAHTLPHVPWPISTLPPSSAGPDGQKQWHPVTTSTATAHILDSKYCFPRRGRRAPGTNG